MTTDLRETDRFIPDLESQSFEFLDFILDKEGRLIFSEQGSIGVVLKTDENPSGNHFVSKRIAIQLNLLNEEHFDLALKSWKRRRSVLDKELVNDHQVIVEKETTDVLANKDKPATNVESSRKDKGNLNGCCSLNCCGMTSFNRRITGSLENLFYRLGYAIGLNPWPTIGLSLLICAALGGGLYFWKVENDLTVLFTTSDSPVYFHSNWVKKQYSDDFRFQSIIITSDNDNNILQPSVLIQIAEMDQAIREITTTEGKQWTDLCGRFGPTIMKNGGLLRRRRSTTDNESLPLELWNDDGDLNGFNFSHVFHDSSNYETADQGSSNVDRRAEYLLDLFFQPDSCLMSSILQIWNFDLERIRSLDQHQILEDVNDALLNDGSRNGQIQSLSLLLSDVRRDANNKVVHVGATNLIWLLENNPNNFSVYTEWEKAFVQLTLNSNASKLLPDGFRVYSFASNSYDDGIAEVTGSNINTVSAGFILVIIYFSFAMGKFNLIEQRLVMSIVGVSAIGLAILASYGLGFYLGVVYGLIHPMIPFLILGIGVDDMFVIINSLDNVSGPIDKNPQLPIHERMALALKHAGVSITVTSVTDVTAFLIGATTTIPTLRSFSISAAISILLLFLLEVTFFVAVAVLDERRKANRSILGCCSLSANKNWEPSTCSQRELFKIYFERVHGPFLMLKPVKVLVLLVTLAIVGVSTWGVFQLEQEFDPAWYLKPSSYQSEYLNAMKHHFPLSGDRATIYTGKIDYIGQRHQLNQMTELLRTDPFIHSPSVTFWYEEFQSWLNQTKKVEFPSDDTTFRILIQEYLLSPDGRHHLPDLKVVNGSLFDLASNFTILSSRGRFDHLLLKNASAKNRALKSILSLPELINFGEEADPPFPIVYAPTYGVWEANRALGSELVRNLGLTMVAVMTITVLLIPDLSTVFWLFTCITFTLVDLLGLAYFWGLTIDLSSSIVSILCVGLAIDYSAHIGHTFTAITGSDKSIRVKQTLVMMGPAVWHGGFSTFLAFVLLTTTDAYHFITFFKLFFGVVLFGLFHGLVYLPVVLSLFGSENVAANISNDIECKPAQTMALQIMENAIVVDDHGIDNISSSIENSLDEDQTVKHQQEASKQKNQQVQGRSANESE